MANPSPYVRPSRANYSAHSLYLAIPTLRFPKYCRYIHSILSTSVFSVRERELIVLAAASVTQAEYVTCVHRRLATSVGLSAETVNSVLAGEVCNEFLDLNSREKNVYRMAREMARYWGRVKEETWEAVLIQDEPKPRRQDGWLETEPDAEIGRENEFRRVIGAAANGSCKAGVDVAEQMDSSCPDRNSDRLSRGEIATLAQVLASTMFVSVLVNCAETQVPQSEPEVV